jgi:hypothetical protein
MISPLSIKKWSKNPSRLKIFGIWFIANFTLWIFFAMSIPNETTNEKITSARENLVKGNYQLVKSELSEIKPTDTFYKEAQIILKQADSLNTIKEVSLKLNEEEKDRIDNVEQLKRELNSIDKGIDFSTYRGSIEALQMELVLFGSWAKIIKENEKFENEEIKSLTKSLKNKVMKMQIVEFPLLRKGYAKVVANKMWENDVDVYSSGTDEKYINFSGGIFAANRNKKEFHNQLTEILTMFRFNQARYRWYKGADEYTYWAMYEGKDSELVTFGK